MIGAIVLGLVALAIIVWAVVTTDTPMDNPEPIENGDGEIDRWGHHAAEEDRK